MLPRYLFILWNSLSVCKTQDRFIIYDDKNLSVLFVSTIEVQRINLGLLLNNLPYFVKFAILLVGFASQ